MALTRSLPGPAHRPPRWGRAICHGSLALGLMVSSTAHACSLPVLMSLPLEVLLTLKIARVPVTSNLLTGPRSGGSRRVA